MILLKRDAQIYAEIEKDLLKEFLDGIDLLESLEEVKELGRPGSAIPQLPANSWRVLEATARFKFLKKSAIEQLPTFPETIFKMVKTFVGSQTLMVPLTNERRQKYQTFSSLIIFA